MSQTKQCQLCYREGEDLSLLKAHHKDKGVIKVCRDCWEKLSANNEIRSSGSTGDSGSSSSTGCPTCGI